MLKTLDILIGTTTVLLVFAMVVTVLTQVMTALLGRKGNHLMAGLADLLQQLGIPERGIAEKISAAVLQHPMISEGKGWRGKVKLGTVIHREEFTKILMAAASGNNATLWCTLDKDAKDALSAMLTANGVADPAATLKNVRAMTMQLESSNPELASDVRQSLALLHEAASDYVATINSWFDQTIDRVSQKFSKNTHVVTVVLASLVVLTVQLDMIAVMNRLSVDDKLRNQIVQTAAKDSKLHSSASTEKGTDNGDSPKDKVATPVVNESSIQDSRLTLQRAGAVTAPDQASLPAKIAPRAGRRSSRRRSRRMLASARITPASFVSTPVTPPPVAPAPAPATTAQSDIPDFNGQSYYDALSDAGLLTMPFISPKAWWNQFNPRKVPGMLVAILLISLGAPFWYNILKDLLGLRSALAKSDDMQRAIRQTTQDVGGGPSPTAPADGSVAPAWLKGERGRMEPWG